MIFTWMKFFFSSDSMMISPLSSDSGRGATYSGPAVTSYRSPTEVTGLLNMYWLLTTFAAKAEELGFGQYAVKEYLPILPISFVAILQIFTFFFSVQKQLDKFFPTDTVISAILYPLRFTFCGSMMKSSQI